MPAPADWGPLAVATASSGDDALITGVITIGQRCVTLDSEGGEYLVVWPAERTMWNGADRSVELTDDTGNAVALTDGQNVSFGGSVGAQSGDDTTSEAVAWVSEPDPECQQQHWFVTGAIRP